MIPHPSYDLDGDGVVSNQDLVLAKHFDKDNDGRLNTGELKAAKEGYHTAREKYFWGIERPGPLRGDRI